MALFVLSRCYDEGNNSKTNAGFFHFMHHNAKKGLSSGPDTLHFSHFKLLENVVRSVSRLKSADPGLQPPSQTPPCQSGGALSCRPGLTHSRLNPAHCRSATPRHTLGLMVHNFTLSLRLHSIPILTLFFLPVCLSASLCLS